MPEGTRSQYYASREFGYDDKYPVLDRHQVIELQGHVNDQKLVKLRYLIPVGVGEELFECAECGALFLSMGTRDSHGELRHDYTCECGWKPSPSVKQKTNALNNHRARCDVYKEQLETDRLRHRAEVREIPNRDGK